MQNHPACAMLDREVQMIRTGEQYRDSIRDGREVWIGGERVRDVTRHPMFKPLVDIRARIYDMQHEAATQSVMTYAEGPERFAQSPPFAQSAAVYRTYDWTSTLKFAQRAGGMSDRI